MGGGLGNQMFQYALGRHLSIKIISNLNLIPVAFYLMLNQILTII